LNYPRHGGRVRGRCRMPPAGSVVVHVATGVLRGESVQGLSRLAQELGLPVLLLDLGGVHTLTAHRLGQLVALLRELRHSRAKLTLLNVRDAARRVLDDAGLAGVLAVRAYRER